MTKSFPVTTEMYSVLLFDPLFVASFFPYFSFFLFCSVHCTEQPTMVATVIQYTLYIVINQFGCCMNKALPFFSSFLHLRLYFQISKHSFWRERSMWHQTIIHDDLISLISSRNVTESRFQSINYNDAKYAI